MKGKYALKQQSGFQLGENMKSTAHALMIAGLCVVGLVGCRFGSGSDTNHTSTPKSASPNILLIVMDDLGVDQFEAFGYGSRPPADTGNINAIAEQGVRFRNAWSMPTCTTTRAAMFTGRYPFRSGVFNAITSNDLANSQVSPYDATVPKLLRTKGYVSALIGKMHLTGSELNPDNNPLGLDDYRALGWDYFAGYLDGAPFPIDTTAGGVAKEGTHQCGFVPTTAVDPSHGADEGICYLPDGRDSAMTLADTITPGRTCAEQGGIFDPGAQNPSESRREQLTFDKANGYYVGQWIINHADGSNEELPMSDPLARGWRVSLETDRAIDWVEQNRQQNPDKPWMMTVGYSANHTPLQPPPAALLPHPVDPDNPLTKLNLAGCGTPVADTLSELGVGENKLSDLTAFAQSRVVAQHMLEAMDHEIGRLLVQTGVAARQDDGTLAYNPDSNTVVVIVGDNGTYSPSVKLPFDPQRAKGTPYQTGVWVPLLVAGPQVTAPDRDVEAMVNTTDLYRLFTKIAGIDADTDPAVGTKPLDAEPMMPYLTELGSIVRTNNFTEVGLNLTSETPPPCVIPSINTCVEIFPQQGVCEDQGGVWYGPGSEAKSQGFDSCCAVNDYLADNGQTPANIFPEDQSAIRNKDYKLVRKKILACGTGKYETTDELYRINQSADPKQLEIDKEGSDLLTSQESLDGEQRANYDKLKSSMDDLFASQSDCPGDGNGDLKVDQTDLEEWERWANHKGGLSSWYDFNHDGKTDILDRDIIAQNMGTTCSL